MFGRETSTNLVKIINIKYVIFATKSQTFAKLNQGEQWHVTKEMS